MEVSLEDLPLVVIVGPTASGKTGIAIKIAKKIGAEIICADSRSIYKDLDIGTAKPLHEEMDTVVHWGIDLVSPGERFTVYDFKAYAEQKISEIRGRGNIPMIVGGTGLYVDSIIFDYKFPSSVQELESDYTKKSLGFLQNYCKLNNINIKGNEKNKVHVLNAIARRGKEGTKRDEPVDNCIIVGILTTNELIRSRIKKRAFDMFNGGMVDEATRAFGLYGSDVVAKCGNIYKLVDLYQRGIINKDELSDLFIKADYQLARRQKTWLRRNKYIAWKNLDQVYEYVIQKLYS